MFGHEVQHLIGHTETMLREVGRELVDPLELSR